MENDDIELPITNYFLRPPYSAQSVDEVVITRLFDANSKLLAVFPNLKDNQHIVQTLYQNTEAGVISFESIFNKHPDLADSIQVKPHETAQVEFVAAPIPKLIELASEGKAGINQIYPFIKLLDQGLLRAAEKIGTKWIPQTYVIDGILHYFACAENSELAKGSWDKVPSKTRYWLRGDYLASGIRFVPGSFARFGSHIGSGTVVMSQAFINIGAYIAGGGCMIDSAARIASCAQIGKNVKFGAGSGIEGILEPAGRLPSIVENDVKIGAMCEVCGIIGEGAVIASGVVMASGKKVIDEETGQAVEPLSIQVEDRQFLVPVIPPYRLAVNGSIIHSNGKTTTDAVILKPGDLRDLETLKHFEKQGVLYS